jgi:hypothetical protein
VGPLGVKRALGKILRLLAHPVDAHGRCVRLGAASGAIGGTMCNHARGFFQTLMSLFLQLSCTYY